MDSETTPGSTRWRWVCVLDDTDGRLPTLPCPRLRRKKVNPLRTTALFVGGCSPQPVAHRTGLPSRCRTAPARRAALEVGDTLPRSRPPGGSTPAARTRRGRGELMLVTCGRSGARTAARAHLPLRLHKKSPTAAWRSSALSNMSKPEVEGSWTSSRSRGRTGTACSRTVPRRRVRACRCGYAVARCVPDRAGRKIRWHTAGPAPPQEVSLWEEDLDAAIEAALAANP